MLKLSAFALLLLAAPVVSRRIENEDPVEESTFKGDELKDEEAEAHAITTDINGECHLHEMAERFKPVFEGWLLLASLAKRLLWEEMDSVMAKFRANVVHLVPNLAHLTSNMAFARTMGKHLNKAAQQVNFTYAQLLQAEYHDFAALGLGDMKHRLDEGKELQILEKIEGDLCNGMRNFVIAARGVEAGTPEVRHPFEMWHLWQESWGAVRVFVKITTQCRIEVPKGEDPKSFMTREHQDEWKVCLGALPYEEDEFPSAVMGCARDDEKIPTARGRDRNRVVRYMGCGKNRVKVEPPVKSFVNEGCLPSDKKTEVSDFLNSMCPQNGISTRECRLYGPFYGVYSHPAADLFGYPDVQEKDRCMAIQAANMEEALKSESKETEPEPQKKAKTPKNKKGRKRSLLEEEEKEPEQCAEPQATAFKGQLNRAMADYIYGSTPPLTYSRSRAWQDGLKRMKDLKETSWDPAQMDYPLPQDRKLDPPLWEMLREAEAGEGLMMVSYGYSGAGKTTTLIGDATAPVGGGRGIDGVLSLYLKENADKIEDVQVRIFEVYGRVSTQTGHMAEATGSGIWGYKLKENLAVYLGPATSFVEDLPEDEEEEEEGPRRGNLDMKKLEAVLDDDAYTYSIKDESPASMAGTMAWHDEVKELLTKIEDIRADEDQFKAGGTPIAHIRGTVNNPKSSRGTLFVLTNIYFKSGDMSPISTVDLAGSEDPAVMVSGFLRFKNREGYPECDPKSGKTPADLMAKYLAKLSSYEEMAASLAWCYELRDVLVECDRQKPERGCVDIHLASGIKEFVRPKLDKEEKWLQKDPRGEDLPWGLEFNWNGKKATFSFDEIFEAQKLGAPVGLSDHKKETNPLGDKWHWAERLWSRCLKDKKGNCKKGSPGVLDFIAMNKKVKSDAEYTKLGKNPSPLTEVPRLLTVSKKGADLGKWQQGGSMGKQVETWKEVRSWFFTSLKELMDKFAAKNMNDEFDRHLRYFTGAIGPIVEEAFFINEALNNMKGYLGIWAKDSQMKPPGTLLSLWPPKDLEVKGKINQVIDYSEGSKISEQGYKIYDFIKASGEEESYAQQLAHGEDNIMLVSMLEYIRGLSVRRKKNTKVLVGTFVRSDIPGADLDCEGARASLEFAQDLSDMVGMNRGLPGILPHFHPR